MAYTEQDSSTTAGAGTAHRYTQGAVLTPSSSTITPTNPLHHVAAGTIATIATTNLDTSFINELVLVADGAITINFTGNITGRTTTLATNDAIRYVLDGTTWRESIPVKLSGSNIIESGSNVGIGMVPVQILDITANQNAQTMLGLLNNSSGAAAESKLHTSNGTDATECGTTGTGFTPSGVFPARVGFVHTNATGGLVLGTNAGPLIISASGNIATETARYDGVNGWYGLGGAPVAGMTVTKDGTSLAGTALYNAIFRKADATKGVFLGYDTSGNIGIVGSVSATGILAFWTHNGSAYVESARIDASRNLQVQGSVASYGRATGDGVWTTFTPTLAASTGTWTVGSGTARYMLVGKSLFVNFIWSGSTVSATPTDLILTIPNSLTANVACSVVYGFNDNGTPGTGYAQASASATTIALYKNVAATGSWAASTTNTTVALSMVIEVQ